MELILGKVSAHYSGRAESELPPHERLVMLKADGTVCIHGDKGFKPLNYMTGTAAKRIVSREDDVLIWRFDNGKEKLEIKFHEILHDVEADLAGDDPGHSAVGGTEDHLQKWLADNLSTLDPNLIFVEREFQTGQGPVDILAEAPGNVLVVIEVKKTAPMVTVSQVTRYREAVQEKFPARRVDAMIAAFEYKPRTVELAAKKNVRLLTLPLELKDQLSKAR